MMIKWKMIEGYPDYEISDNGQVKSLKFGKTKILKQSINSSGYQQIYLYRSGERKNYGVHRLVIKAFSGPCSEGKECNHIDGIKSNNCVENLEWITSVENIQHALKTGLKIANCGNGIIPEKSVQQFTKNGDFIAKYKSQAEAKRKTKISQSNISCCCNGKLKSAGDFIWRFAN